MENSYSIPEGFRVYAIGDVHGHLSALHRMHNIIMEDMRGIDDVTAHIVYLGDYIDRGPDSASVIDYLLEQRDKDDGIYRSFLLGNHEHSMIRFMQDEDISQTAQWLRWGGVETSQSYGFEFRTFPPVSDDISEAREYLNTHVPEEHWMFLTEMPLAIEIGDYFFAHAGVDPKKPYDEQEIRDLTAIRQPFLSWYKEPEYKPFKKKVVHGHTISRDPVIRPHRIGVDTGLYQGGALTAAVLEGDSVRFLQVSGK